MNPPPPPPPPHGTNSGSRSGLPPGNYDIFVIPPHSAGSGFLYLPSLQTHRNSFLAGVGCTLVAVAIWTVVFPVLREWFATIVASGGMAVVVLLIGVGVAGWAWGKTQTEAGGSHTGGATGASASSSHPAGGPPPQNTAPPPPPPPPPPPTQPEQPIPEPEPRPPPSRPPPPHSSWQRAQTGPAGTGGTPRAGGAAFGAGAGASTGTTNAGAAKGAWEKAREETRKKEEERKRAEELRKKREELEQERIKQREKDAREREVRERREKREQELKERAQELKEKAQAAPPPPRHTAPKAENPRPESPTKRHQQPTAKTATEDDAYSFRPYDKPKRPTHTATTASSIYSESSYAPSQSTSRTTPPPSHRGPYRNKDPDKIVLKAVYSFNNAFTRLPIAQLVSGAGSVTDGLVLRITTEGLFIDDDVRGVPQREWDVKAWTLKLVETGEFKGLHVLRANIRDAEGKRYIFVLQEEEGWKVAVGLQRLRRGTQVRALGVSGMSANEAKGILENMGWPR